MTKARTRRLPRLLVVAYMKYVSTVTILPLDQMQFNLASLVYKVWIMMKFANDDLCICSIADFGGVN